jgi:hypothetical protein
MDANEFVQRLSTLAPSRESLQRFGLSEQEIVSWMKGFRARRKKRVSESRFSDALLHLVDVYDASSVEIGMVCLARNVTRERDAYLVGQVEADELLVDPSTFEVRCEEFGAPGHVLWHCAADGGKFLDAMIMVAEFYSTATVDVDPSDDTRAARHCARRCAEAAGGEAYQEFYQMLTGGYEE